MNRVSCSKEPLDVTSRWWLAVKAVEQDIGNIHGDHLWCLGFAVKRWRFLVPGDVLYVAVWNGQAQRQLTWCQTIRGPLMRRRYVQYLRWKGGESFNDKTPMVVSDLPGELVNLSPVAPAVLSYVAEEHARVLRRLSGKRE